MVQLTAAELQAYQCLNLGPNTVRSPDDQASADDEGMWVAAEDVSEAKSADQDGASEAAEVGEPCATTALSSADCTISGEPRITAESKSLSRQFTEL